MVQQHIYICTLIVVVVVGVVVVFITLKKKKPRVQEQFEAMIRGSLLTPTPGTYMYVLNGLLNT